jgi:heptose-I-phosphate ethanolaminephosphotransferase
MKISLKSLFYWFLPMLTSLIIQGFNFGWNKVVLKNSLENILTIVILISFFLLFNFKTRKILQYIFYFLWTLSCLIETIYFYIFKANLSASSIYILLETNLAESKEFLEFYLNPSIVLIIITFSSFIFFFFYYQRIIKFEIPPIRIKILALSTFLFSSFYLSKSGYSQYNFAFLAVKSTREYIQEYIKIESYQIGEHLVDIEDFIYKGTTDSATFVLVLGESTTRKRLSLYGYSRNTTPYIKSLKNDLLVYEDVISSNAYTIGSLRNSLTLNGLQDENDFSIIQLMNKAGFKTFWLSNQRPIGKYESLVTKIASASDNYLIKNTAIDGNITPFDQVLIPHFKEALKDKAALKFIVIHPLGTHMDYTHRYPESFNLFSGLSTSNFDNARAHELSNAYDNAVLYHDFLLKQLHEELMTLKEPAYMLYLSDHGEEVFNDINFAGHLDDNPTSSMYEIPFFLWMNASFKKEISIDFNPKRPYSIKDFMHSFADLNQIRFKAYKSEKSIFSKDFKPVKRIIGQRLDYDAYFKSKIDNLH